MVVPGYSDGGESCVFSATWCSNRVSYGTFKTVNFAFWNDFGYSPTDIHDGTLTSSQATFNVDLATSLGDNWHRGFGAQYLRQRYQIVKGDIASGYGGNSGVTGGAQGFAGWGPQATRDNSRHSLAESVH